MVQHLYREVLIPVTKSIYRITIVINALPHVGVLCLPINHSLHTLRHFSAKLYNLHTFTIFREAFSLATLKNIIIKRFDKN